MSLMISAIEEGEIPPEIPELAGKKALEFSPSLRPLSRLLQNKGARFTARLGSKGDREAEKDSCFVLSHWEALPFLDGAWDFFLIRASLLKGDVTRLLREAARVLSPQGMILFTDIHPHSPILPRDLPKGAGGDEERRGLERAFKGFREAGFSVQRVRETFFEGPLRKFFVSAGEKKILEGLKKTPFLIFFLAKKDG